MQKMFSELEGLDSILSKTKLVAEQAYVNADRKKSAYISTCGLASEVLPNDGIGSEQVLEKFQKDILPNLSASVGPRFLGYVTGGATPAALSGDWLVSALDQNLMIGGDSISVDLERNTVEMLMTLFDLPSQRFLGVFTSGATASNVDAMAVAREWAGEKLGVQISDQGLKGENIRVLSANNHASINKAISIVGIGRNNLVNVSTQANSESIDIKALQDALDKHRDTRNIVVANAGTVNTGSFDNLLEVAELCESHDAWLHVDAAFGIFTRLSDKLAHLSAGLERADSITVDLHKWLNVPYDCGLLLTKHAKLQQRVFRNNASYLVSESEHYQPMDVGIENSRRFRALPVWFSLLAYGRYAFKEMVENHCFLARELAQLLEESGLYKVIETPKLNIVCFSALSTEGKLDSEATQKVMELVNAGGSAFFTPTIINGQKYIRAAFSNWRTKIKDVELIVSSLLEAYKVVYSETQ